MHKGCFIWVNLSKSRSKHLEEPVLCSLIKHAVSANQSERALYGNFIINTIRLYWVCIKLGEKNGNYFNNKSVPIK